MDAQVIEWDIEYISALLEDIETDPPWTDPENQSLYYDWLVVTTRLRLLQEAELNNEQKAALDSLRKRIRDQKGLLKDLGYDYPAKYVDE